MADTQGDLITLDAAAFKKFRNELDAINDGLDKMGEGLGNVEKLVKGLDLRVRGLPSFREFLQTVSSYRGLRNADKFKALLQAAKDIAAASRELGTIDPSVVKRAEFFTKAIDSLRNVTSFASVSGNGNFKQFGDNLKSMFKAVTDSLGALKADKSIYEGIDRLTRAATGIKLILTVVGNINALPRIGLNVSALEGLRSLIAQLNAVAAGINGAKAEQLILFGKALQTLGNLFGKGTGNVIGDLARNVGNFIKFGVVIPALIVVIRGVMTIMNLITAVPGTISGVLLKKFDTTFMSFAQTLSILGKALGQGRGTGFSGGIGDLLRSTGTVVKLGVVLPALFAVMTSFFKLTGALTSIIPGNDQMFALADAFRRIASAFFNFSESLKDGGRGRLDQVALLFGKMAAAFKAVSALVRFIPGGDQLERLSVAFRNIGLALVSFNDALGGSKNSRTLVGGGLSATFGRMIKLGVAVPATFAVMTVLFKSIAAIARALPGNDTFLRFAEGFRSLGSGLTALSEFANLNVKSAVRGLKVVQQLTDGIRKVAANLISKGIFNEVMEFMKNFGVLGSGLKAAATAFAGITLVELLLLPIKFKILGEAIGIMSRAVVGKDANGAQVFALVMRNLGQALKNIRIALSENGKAGQGQLLSIFNIVKILVTLRLVMNTISSVAKSAPASAIEAAGRLVNSAGRLFKSLFEVFSSTIIQKVQVKNVLSIRDKMNLIKDIFKQLRQFAGKELPDFGKTFDSLPKFLSTISNLEVKEGKGAESLRAKMKVITDVLRELARLKIDRRALDTLTKLATALSSFAKLKSPGKIEALVKAVVDAMTQIKGFTVNARDIGQLSKFIDALVKSLQKFETLKTTREQVDALKALIAAVKEFKGVGSADIGKNIQQSVRNSQPRQIGNAAGQDIAEGVAEGMFRFNLRVKIIGIFVGIARAIVDLFNPINLFNRLREGFTFLNDKINQLFSVTTRLRNLFKGIGDDIRNMGNSIGDAGRNLIDNFGIQNILNSPAFQEAVNFDKLTTQVQTFGNLTDDEVQRVRKLAFQIGKDFPQSAGDALAAAKDLIKAGLDTTAVEAALPVIANLTALTETGDITIASRGLIQVASTFKEFAEGVPADFDNLSVAADLLSQAADGSTASVESLLLGLGNVGPIASQFGLTLKETVAVLGLFENAGIRGAEAGTQLKSLLTALNTDRARAEFRRLGVALTDEAGNFRNLNDILNDLNASFNETQVVTRTVSNLTADQRSQIEEAEKAYAAATRQLFIYQNGLSTGAVGLSEEDANARISEYQQIQANAAALIAEITGSQAEADRITVEISRNQQQNAASIQELAGSFGGVGLAALLAQGDDALKNFMLTMDGLPGAAARAQQLMDNFAGDAEQLKGSLETLGIIGFEPLIKNIFRPFVQLLRLIVDTTLQLDTRVIELVVTTGALAAIFATLTGGILVLVGGITQLGGSVLVLTSYLFNQRALFLGLVKVAAGFTVGLITLAAAAIPLIVIFGSIAYAIQQVRAIFEGDLGGARTKFDELRKTVGRVFTSFGYLSNAVVGFFGVLLGGGDEAKNPLESAGALFAGFFDRLAKGADQIATVAHDVALGISVISEVLKTGTLTSFGVDLLSKNPLIGLIFGVRNETISEAGIRGLIDQIAARARRIKNIMNAIRNTFANFFKQLGEGARFGDAFDFMLRNLKLNFSTLASETLKLFGDIFKIDVSAVTDIFDRGDLSGGIKLLVSTFGQKIKDFILNNRTNIGDVLETLFRAFFVPGRLLGRVASLLGLDKLATIFDEVGNVLGSLFRGVVDTIFNLMSGQDLGTALQNAFGPLGPSIVNSIINIISAAIGGLGDLLGIDTTSFVEQIKRGFQPLIDDFESGNYDDLLFDIGAAVVSLIAVAIQTAVAGLGSILGIDTSQATEQIRIGFVPLQTALEQDAGVGAIFGGVATALATLLVTAFELAIGGIGQLFNIDTQTIFDQLTIGFTPLADAIRSNADGATIFSGLVSAVTGIIAAALVTGIESIGSILQIDTSKVVASIAASVQATADAAAEGDVVGAGTGLVGTVVNGIAGLLKTGIEKIGDVLGIDTTAMTSSLQTTIDNNLKALETGGPGAPFALVGTTIIGLLASAVSGAVSGLGDLLNIDVEGIQAIISEKFAGVLGTLNDLFLGTDGSSVFDSITTIVNNIVIAFQGLFSLFSPSETGQVDEGVSVLQRIGDFFGNLAGLAFDALNIPLRAIDSIFTTLANAEPLELAAALGALAAVLAIRAVSSATGITTLSQLVGSLQHASLAGGVASVKGLIRTAATSTIAQGAAIFVIFNFIASLIDNLEYLQTFDVAGIFTTIVKTFTDFGFNLLEILGIDTGTLRQQINTTIFQIGFLIRSLGLTLGTFLQDNVFTPFRLFIEEGFLNLRIMGEFIRLNLDSAAQERFRATLEANKDFVSRASVAVEVDGRLVDANTGEVTNFADYFNNVVLAGVGQFGDAIEGPIVKEQLRLAAQSVLPGLISGFQTEFDAALGAGGEVTEQSRAIAAKWVQSLLFLDGFDDVAREAAASGDVNLLGVLIEEAAKQGVPADQINAAIGGIYAAFQSGLASGQGAEAFTNAINLLDMLIANATELGLDPATLEAWKTKVTDEYNLLVAAAQDSIDNANEANNPDGTGAGVDVPVTVDPTVEVAKTPEELAIEAQQAAQHALESSDTDGDGTPDIPVDVNMDVTVTGADGDPAAATEAAEQALTNDDGTLTVAPETLISLENVSTPEDAAALQAALIPLNAELAVTATNLSLVNDEVDDLETSLITLNTTTLPTTDTTFATTIANMMAAWTPFGLAVKTDMVAINTSLKDVDGGIVKIQTTLTVIVPPALGLLAKLETGFTTLKNTVLKNFADMYNSANALKGVLDEVLAKIATIGTAELPGGAGGNPPGGQSGITVHPNRLYEVTETGAPELLTMNGRTFLLPGAGGTGQVIPAINATSLTGSRNTVGTPRVSPGGQSGVGGDIIIQEGSISVSIPVTNGDPDVIAARVRDVIVQERANERKRLADRLRDSGR